MVDGPNLSQTPRLQSRDAFRVAGLDLICDEQTRVQIPQLWQRLAPSLGSIPGQKGAVTYGVSVPLPGDTFRFRYVAGAEVDELPGGDWAGIEVPAAEYVVFEHHGSLAGLHQTIDYAFRTWLPGSDYVNAGTADFERYDDRFDPMATDGAGSMLELWIPVVRPTGDD